MKKQSVIIVLLLVIHACSFAQIKPPGRFHQMLTRSNGLWRGQSTMQFSSEAQRVDGGVSMLVNKMSSDGLYQISEIKGNTNNAPWTGLRTTGYDSAKKVFTRAMIGDSPTIEGVVMEGQWDEAKRSITFPFKKTDRSGKERMLKEVYTFVDENTELLEIYATDPNTNKEFMLVQVKWMRQQ